MAAYIINTAKIVVHYHRRIAYYFLEAHVEVRSDQLFRVLYGLFNFAINPITTLSTFDVCFVIELSFITTIIIIRRSQNCFYLSEKHEENIN